MVSQGELANLIYESPKVNEEKPKLSQIALEITNTNEEKESTEDEVVVSSDMQSYNNMDSDVNEKERKKIKWTWSKIIYVLLALMSFTLIIYAIIACIMANKKLPDTRLPDTKLPDTKLSDTKLSDTKLSGTTTETRKKVPWISPLKVTLLTPKTKPNRLPEPQKGFLLSPFWNFERNPFMCGASYPVKLNNDNQAWCDQLFEDVNINPDQGLDHWYNMEIPALNPDSRKILDFRNHYTILRDLKVYKDKPYIWWFNKSESEICTNDLIPNVSFVPKYTSWKTWNEDTKNELKQFLKNHFNESNAKSLIIKPGHTHRSHGVMSIMNKELNQNDKIIDNQTKIISYDKNAFEKIVNNIDNEFYMDKDDFGKDENKEAVPSPQNVSPSIIVEERIADVLEIKCVFIFGVLKQCFTRAITNEYQAKFNRDFDCVISVHDGQQPETYQNKCENLLGLMDWHTIIPRLEQLAYKMGVDRIRIDIFYIDYYTFYINEYESRDGSFHGYNEYLFNALKEAWKTPNFYANHKEMDQLNCSEHMKEELKNYIKNSSLK